MYHIKVGIFHKKKDTKSQKNDFKNLFRYYFKIEWEWILVLGAMYCANGVGGQKSNFKIKEKQLNTNFENSQKLNLKIFFFVSCLFIGIY